MRIGSWGALVVGFLTVGIAFLNLASPSDENVFWLLALLGLGS